MTDRLDPSGEGSDLAGVVEDVGEDVREFRAGDEVIGFSHNRDSHAEFVAVDIEHLVRRPSNVPWEQAGSLERHTRGKIVLMP